ELFIAWELLFLNRSQNNPSTRKLTLSTLPILATSIGICFLVIVFFAEHYIDRTSYSIAHSIWFATGFLSAIAGTIISMTCGKELVNIAQYYILPIVVIPFIIMIIAIMANLQLSASACAALGVFTTILGISAPRNSRRLLDLMAPMIRTMEKRAKKLPPEIRRRLDELSKVEDVGQLGNPLRLGKARAALSLLISPLVAILAFGIFALSLTIRIGATLQYIVLGLRSMPDNFRRLTLCTSPLQEPELVPGLESSKSSFTIRSSLEVLRHTWHSGDIYDRIFAIVAIPFISFIWFFPAWFYRITLKSTAWFWWPLAFLGDEVRRAKDPDEFRWTISGSLWARTSIVVAIVAMAAFFISNFVLTGAILKDNPLLTPLGYFLVVDWALLPWQMLTVAVSILSLVIVFWLNHAGGLYTIAKQKQDMDRLAKAELSIEYIERVARLRLVLVILLWILVAGQALLFFNSRNCWVKPPANVERWAEWAYGKKAGQARCLSIARTLGKPQLVALQFEGLRAL